MNQLPLAGGQVCGLVQEVEHAAVVEAEAGGVGVYLQEIQAAFHLPAHFLEEGNAQEFGAIGLFLTGLEGHFEGLLGEGLVLIVHQDGTAEGFHVDGFGVLDHHHFAGPFAQAVVVGGVVVQILVNGGKNVEHPLVRQFAFRVQRGNIFAVNLAHESEGVVEGFPILRHLDGGVFHIGRKVRVSPPLGAAEKLRLRFLEVNLDSHRVNVCAKIAIFCVYL